jgi:hypothetical protein
VLIILVYDLLVGARSFGLIIIYLFANFTTPAMDFEQSKSLLDTVLERVRVVEKVVDEQGNEEVVTQIPSYSRLLYVGEIASGVSVEQVTETYREFIQEVAPDPEEAETTLRGVLLMHSTCVAHVVEAPAEIVVALLQRLHSAVNTESDDGMPLFSSIRIIMTVEDCPTTLFQRPFVVQLPAGFAGSTNANVDVGSTATASLGLYGQIIALAQVAPDLNAPPSAVEAFTQGVPSSHASAVPSASSILGFARSDKVMPVEEYLDIYAVPVTVTTSSDGIHPAGMGMGN